MEKFPNPRLVANSIIVPMVSKVAKTPKNGPYHYDPTKLWYD